MVIDVAHEHMPQVIETTKRLKQTFGKKVDIVAGNVATYEGAVDLFKAGADSVKIGIGPGSTCITRIETGCGVPQISAVLECSKAAREYKGTLICDGGMKNSGDIVKGLAAGASAVMTGYIFAGIKKLKVSSCQKTEKVILILLIFLRKTGYILKTQGRRFVLFETTPHYSIIIL